VKPVEIECQIIKHCFLPFCRWGIQDLTFDHIAQLARKTVGQLHIFDALGVAPTAITDNHIDIVGGYVATAHVAIIIVFSVKWADV
jgi:hypothetical protein